MYNNKSQKQETQYTQIKQNIIKTDLSVGVYSPNPNSPTPNGISNLVWHPLERLCLSKMLLHYTIMRKMIVFLFILTQRLMISILPCKDLS